MTAKSLQRKFPIGIRVCLVCDPDWIGKVAAIEGNLVMVSFAVGLQVAIGRHSPAALVVVK